MCTLLDRAERRIVPLEVRYVGIEVPGDAFLLGYGLHFAERYRNLPVVVAVDQAAVRADPDAYLGIYQGSWSAPSDGAAAGATAREGIRDPR